MKDIYIIGISIIFIIFLFYLINKGVKNIQKFNDNKNIIVYTPGPFTEQSGGINVLYYFAKILDESGKNVRIYYKDCDKNKSKNPYLNKYYNNDFDITKAIIIYPEIIKDNPLNSKYVVRWIMAPLGLNCSKDIYKTWGKNDLVYYFNFQSRFDNNNDYGTSFKLLPIII